MRARDPKQKLTVFTWCTASVVYSLYPSKHPGADCHSRYWIRMRLHSWRHRAAREVTEIRATEAATSRIGLAPRRTRRKDHEREEHDRTCGGGGRCCSPRGAPGGGTGPEARRPRGHAGGGEDPVNRRRPAGC